MTTRTIRNPMDWVASQLVHVAHGLGATGHALHHAVETLHAPVPQVRRIGMADLREALIRGWSDFTTYRTDVFFLVVLYPVVMLVLLHVAFGMRLLPLLFPLASGFALIGPFLGVGLYEMSRRRERGMDASWRNGIDVLKRPAIGGILVLGLMVTVIFLAWLATAWGIFADTMGPALPRSFASFLHDVFTTGGGWLMIVLGVGIGFLFAVFVMTISVVSFPLMVDRDIGVDAAIATSYKAVIGNLVPMAMWGIVVVLGLIVAAIPLGVGLILVMPVLGHATWHLYRRLVPA